MNPYVHFVLPKLRVVIKLFNEMTPEQKESMLRDNHLIYYNFEDVINLMHIMDENAADSRRQLAQAERQLAELDE